MGQAELLIAGLLVAVAGLGALARRLSIPYPIVLVIGGALFGFVPGLPEVNLDPDVVLVVFLPPLLYSAAFFANLGDIRAEPARDHDQLGRARARDDGRGRDRRARAHPRHAVGGGVRRSARSSPPPTRWRRRDHAPARRPAPPRERRRGRGPVQRRDRAGRLPGRGRRGRRRQLLARGRRPRFVLGAAGGVAIGLAVGWVVAEIRKRTDRRRRSASRSRCSPATRRSSPPTPSAPRACSRRSRPASTWASAGRSIIPRRARLQGSSSGTSSTSSSTRSCSCSSASSCARSSTALSGLLGRRRCSAMRWRSAGVVVLTRMVWFFTMPYLSARSIAARAQRARRMTARDAARARRGAACAARCRWPPRWRCP